MQYKDGFRKIRIFIPEPMKPIELDQKFLFMTDAQNLFDDSTSYAGEWQVDESILEMPTDKRPIVIGIDHGNGARLDELTPYLNKKYGGGNADEFLVWVTDTVMPHVETRFNHTLQPEHTAIAGSSLGGLFSHYAILKRPDLFKTAGVFSPSFWFSENIFEFTGKTDIKDSVHLFLSGGTKESDSLISELNRMTEILSAHTSISHDLHVIADAGHNEKQWREVFPIFLQKIYSWKD